MFRSAHPWAVAIAVFVGVEGVAAPPAGQVGTIESVERTRGGRHWIDEKTAPPKSPAESMACFRIEDGFRLELVAAEPLVRDPVAVAFDTAGRMFVVEYGDYPTGPEEGDPLSQVVLLRDTDEDGDVDKRVVFADKLTFAHSLMPYRDGILVGAQTEIVHLVDTDGDDRADKRTVLFRGFKPAHPQMQIGNPRWGLDNRVYLNYGPGQITSPGRDNSAVNFPSRDFSFDPHTLEFAADSGLGQFGNTVDNWGHRFFTTNRNPIMMSVLSPSVANRNPHYVVSRAYTDVGKAGGETRVYPLVAMKSNWLSHAGTHTSACGVTAYRGPLFGEEGTRSVFVCEPVGHLVTRSILDYQRVVPEAHRAKENEDFLASTDTWFRPASLATGPDGALYLADMYRLWVEHPKFLPPDIAERIDWRAGEDRGRIWRILPTDGNRRGYSPPRDDEDLVAMLNSDNGWQRGLAQRVIVERRDAQFERPVEQVLYGSARGIARLHALWTLHGLGTLTPAHLQTALRDSDAFVRRDAVRIAADQLAISDELLGAIVALAHDDDVRVRFQVALALGATDDARATPALVQLALRDGGDLWFRTGWLTSTAGRSGELLRGLVADAAFVRQAGLDRIELIKLLAGIIGVRGDSNELLSLLRTIGESSERGSTWWETAALIGLAQGLPRNSGAVPAKSLGQLMKLETPAFARLMGPIRERLVTAQRDAAAPETTRSARLAAIELMSFQPFAETRAAFEALIGAQHPLPIRRAALNAMRSGGASAAQIVQAKWGELGPLMQQQAIGFLLSRNDSTRTTLEDMRLGRIPASAVGLDQRIRLLRHSDASIRQLSEDLFGGAVSANRQKVADEYQAALALSGSVVAGARVFDKTCAKCHRVDGKGHTVGPDISDVRNRSRAALLHDILDPNRKVEPQFAGYVVTTVDGRVFNGLLTSETDTAIVLRQAEGKDQLIPRRDIEEMVGKGQSLMPEGVEKEVTVQQMADLLAYLKAPIRNRGQ